MFSLSTKIAITQAFLAFDNTQCMSENALSCRDSSLKNQSNKYNLSCSELSVPAEQLTKSLSSLPFLRDWIRYSTESSPTAIFIRFRVITHLLTLLIYLMFQTNLVTYSVVATHLFFTLVWVLQTWKKLSAKFDFPRHLKKIKLLNWMWLECSNL